MCYTTDVTIVEIIFFLFFYVITQRVLVTENELESKVLLLDGNTC